MTVPASAGVTVTMAYTESQADPVELPMFVTAPPADPSRLFVVERAGRIRIAVDGQMQDEAFLDIRALVDTNGESGMASMQPAPDYADSGLFYVFFVEKPDIGSLNGDIRIEEFRRSADNPNVADIATRRLVLEVPHDDDWIHYGGTMHFSPLDGLLYIGTGDGGGQGDPFHNGQDTTTLLGKILRIDPRQSGTDPYTVPPGNLSGEVLAYGLRNPFRWSFDRLTGDIVIGDVGQSSYEEVDYVPAAGTLAGANFGWNCWEAFQVWPPGCTAPSYVPPVFAYAHLASAPSSITGGVVVRDPDLPALAGRYLYADHYIDAIRSLELAVTGATDDRLEVVGTKESPLRGITSFGQDALGRIYVTSFAGGVYRLVSCDTDCPTSGAGPQPSDETPQPVEGAPGSSDAANTAPATVSADAPAASATDEPVSAGPVLALRVAAAQDIARLHYLSLNVACDQLCVVRVSADLRTRARTARAYRLPGKLVHLDARQPALLRLTLSRRARSALRKALARGEVATIVVTVRARGAGGRLTTLRRVVRVRRLPRRP
jgi:glucose/arabinose dehydrogenase